MKGNPFAINPYRKQPRRKCCPQNPVQPLVEGMVTLGSVAVIGGTTVAVLNAFKP